MGVEEISVVDLEKRLERLEGDFSKFDLSLQGLIKTLNETNLGLALLKQSIDAQAKRESEKKDFWSKVVLGIIGVFSGSFILWILNGGLSNGQ